MRLGFNNEIKADRVELLFIPEYIVSALKSRGTSLVEFETLLRQPLRRYIDNANLLNTDGKNRTMMANKFITTDTINFIQYLKEKLSMVDIEDLLIYNNLYNLRFSNSKYSDTFLAYIINEGFGSAVWELNLNNNNCDTVKMHKTMETLYDNNMRIINENISLPFEFQQGTDCLFVVLKYGFTNYILDNDFDKRVFIFSKLFNKIVSSFGESRALRGDLVSIYLKLLKSVNN